MFKVGELVKIKRLAEITETDKQLHLSLPEPSMTKRYCGKIGRVIRVDQSSKGERYLIRLNITKDFGWYDVELTSFDHNNFIPLQICLS